MSIIRTATFDDLEAITHITNHAIIHTNALWEEKTVSLENRKDWLIQKQEKNLPVFVIQASPDIPIAGFGTYGPFRPHEGYALSLEHSLYIDPQNHGKGYGTLMLQQLVKTARQRSFHIMVGAISADNTVSIRMHEKAGFLTSGIIPQVGRKFGHFLDLVLMHKILSQT